MARARRLDLDGRAEPLARRKLDHARAGAWRPRGRWGGARRRWADESRRRVLRRRRAGRAAIAPRAVGHAGQTEHARRGRASHCRALPRTAAGPATSTAAIATSTSGNRNVNVNSRATATSTSTASTCSGTRRCVRRPRAYARAPYAYGGRRYYAHHAYGYHRYRPYSAWGVGFHPFGAFVRDAGRDGDRRDRREHAVPLQPRGLVRARQRRLHGGDGAGGWRR